jgi:hypothetical protein
LNSSDGQSRTVFQPEFCRQHDGLCYNLPKPAPFPSNNEEVISFEESRRMAQAVASHLVQQDDESL